MHIYAQKAEVTDFLMSLSNEVLLVNVVEIGPCTFGNAWSCHFTIQANVEDMLVNTNFSKTKKQILFSQRVEIDDGKIPNDKALRKGRYFIFLETDPEYAKRSATERIVFSVVDRYLGILAYSPDLYQYLKEKKK
jgi:hypothetical protein